ncbi:MAG: phosphoglycerate kinase [Parachlamydiaceae bacterium]|nr:phosphoglycerate kinase [Parachlamydiaceae bacterium]
MPKYLSITDLPLKNKRVLMRVDFNVPLDKQGNITDDTRIRASLPSIRYALEQGASVILMSHLGRPKDNKSTEFSLLPCAKRLEQLLTRPINMAPDCVGSEVEILARQLKPGQILMLENLRFHRGEEHPEEDPTFTSQLAKLGDVYVNDAFGTAHRSHASTAKIANFFPNESAAGLLLQKEIQFLGQALLHPKKPFYAIIGGAKISTKLGVLKALVHKADLILIGGGMTYTFLKAQGIAIGDSIHEDSHLEEAKEILALSKELNVPLLFPEDLVVANRIDNNAEIRIINASEGIPSGFQGVDIGPRTIQLFSRSIQDAGTLFWNGPMGVFEIPAFANGTNAIAHAVANLSAITIVGGGESVAAVEASGEAQKINHISTGGGAALEYIEFGTLPGIEALTIKKEESLKN